VASSMQIVISSKALDISSPPCLSWSQTAVPVRAPAFSGELPHCHPRDAPA
jgi:hypothetical protein